MTGIVDDVHELQYGPRRGAFVFGFIRAADGRRFFVHATECGGRFPKRFDTVTFDVSDADERGPRAVRVQVIDAPAPVVDMILDDVEVRCSECGRPFQWSAGAQHFYQAHRYASTHQMSALSSHRSRAPRVAGMSAHHVAIDGKAYRLRSLRQVPQLRRFRRELSRLLWLVRKADQLSVAEGQEWDWLLRRVIANVLEAPGHVLNRLSNTQRAEVLKVFATVSERAMVN